MPCWGTTNSSLTTVAQAHWRLHVHTCAQHVSTFRRAFPRNARTHVLNKYTAKTTPDSTQIHTTHALTPNGPSLPKPPLPMVQHGKLSLCTPQSLHGIATSRFANRPATWGTHWGGLAEGWLREGSGRAEGGLREGGLTAIDLPMTCP